MLVSVQLISKSWVNDPSRKILSARMRILKHLRYIHTVNNYTHDSHIIRKVKISEKVLHPYEAGIGSTPDNTQLSQYLALSNYSK